VSGKLYNLTEGVKNMFGSLGFWEILLIIFIIAVLFGGKKLAQLGKGLGEGIVNFKASLKKDPDKQEEESDSNNEKNN
jgi:sec-independent protein translocase protein TatA